MTERQLDNIRIATRTLTYFVACMALFFLLSMILAFLRVPADPKLDTIYPHEVSYSDLVISFFLLLPLVLAFVLPIIVLKREFQNRKERDNGSSIVD